jgi:ABC-2 type transport system ATP-binding protein
MSEAWHMPVIRASGLGKIYKNTREWAVTALDIDICQGEIFGLLGPNGAGKTTTISMMCGLFSPGTGKIEVEGAPLTGNSSFKQIMGVVPQDIALYPTLTVKENLDYFGRMFGLLSTELKRSIEKYTGVFGLEEVMNKRINTLSGGMKRRINLLAALLHTPRILFLDEPTVGIDVQSRLVIIDFLRQLNKEGTTLIYTSHDMTEAQQFCTRVAIMDHGRIICTGKPKELLREHPEFADLENIFIHLTGKELRN